MPINKGCMACIVSLNRLYRPQATGYRIQQRNNSSSSATATATATAMQAHNSNSDSHTPQLYTTAIQPMQKAKKMGMRIWIWHPPLSLSIGFLIGGHCPCHHTTQTLWVSNIFYYLCIKANNYEKDI